MHDVELLSKFMRVRGKWMFKYDLGVKDRIKSKTVYVQLGYQNTTYSMSRDDSRY